MPLLNTPNSENQAINTPLSEQKPAKFEKSRLTGSGYMFRWSHRVFLRRQRIEDQRVSASQRTVFSRQLLAGAVPRLDLRIASRFQGAPGRALHMALQDAADTIVRMPAYYINYPGGEPVLPTERRRAANPAGGIIVLNEAYL